MIKGESMQATTTATKPKNNRATREAAIRAAAVAELKTYLKPGDEIQLILRHRSRSGMFRRISPILQHRKRGTLHLDYLFHRAFNPESSKRVGGGDGVPVSGCGMDMGFHLVYTVAAYMWPKGAKLPKGMCGRNGDKSGYETSGGYLLKSHWL
jgi:hypothetical protein